MSAYVAAYDVAEDSRRSRIVRVLDDYGHRVQQSVFMVWVEPEEIPVLRLKLADHPAVDDHFDLFPIDQRGTRQHWRWQRPIDDYDSVVLI